MNDARQKILSSLMGQQQHISGQTLSQSLGISRTAVWKHIQILKEEGYVIESIRKKGYRLLAEPEQLTASAIMAQLTTAWLGQTVYTYAQVRSTQEIAHQLAGEHAPSGTVIIADCQEQGRGRLGRAWHSPPKTGIWMSFIIRPRLPLTSVPQLTLLSAVAILRAIREVTGIEADIKWPNDLLINGKKVCGILTELSAEADQVKYIVLGIGMNVNQTQHDFSDDVASVATSLAVESGAHVSRQALLIHIIQQWEALYELFVEQGFRPIKTLWEAHCSSLGKTIVARTLQGQYRGMATGITDEGILLLEEPSGQVQKIYSADIDPAAM